MLFDLDGVLVPTIDLHQRAWHALFNDFFSQRGVEPRYTAADYVRYVDGRPRFDAVAAVLSSRSIALPPGDPGDPPEVETVAGLGNRKNAAFLSFLTHDGIAPYPGTIRVLGELAKADVAMAVVSSSANARAVLREAGLEGRFRFVVDGILSADEGLEGKPAADTFAWAAARLGVAPGRTAVVEDALSGVRAARVGGFGLVVGVDRGAGAQALRAEGAGEVVEALPDALPLLLAAP